jgi:hypothetical protein
LVEPVIGECDIMARRKNPEVALFHFGSDGGFARLGVRRLTMWIET